MSDDGGRIKDDLNINWFKSQLTSCGLIPLPGSAKLHTGSGMTKVDFYCAQMTSGVWGQWLSLCQVYRTAFRSRDIICDKIYGLKVGLHCFKELQFIGQSETMEKNIVCWSAMATDKECVVGTTTAKSLIGQLAPGQCGRGNWSTIGQTGFIKYIKGKWRLSRTGKNFFLEKFSDYCLVKPPAASLKAWIPCLEPVLKYTDPLCISGDPWSSVQSREVICA